MRSITREKIINAFLFCSFERTVGGTSLQDIADYLGVKKASLYSHFSSREEMYNETIRYCRSFLQEFRFIPENFMKLDLFQKKTLDEVCNTLIQRYIQLYESEPMLQIYSFVHSEMYFNKNAADIVDEEIKALEYGVSQLFLIYCNDKKVDISPIELDTLVKIYAANLFSKLDLYLMHKKEILRQNPECGIGSLFALPTDDSALEELYHLSNVYLSIIMQ